MKFGTFYELTVPRPWESDTELEVFQQSLDQIELADRLGFDFVWEVEHHMLEEYAHSSAPGVFLGAVSQRTDQIRLGHGIRLMPPKYNHPARVAEMTATLDLVSGGRVELGTGESSSRQELDGFGVSFDKRHDMWEEATEQVADMMAMTPYPAYDGEYFSMPTRNVVPKPVQKPHPPLWVACSNPDTIELAAKMGIGALVIKHDTPEDAGQWRDEYYATLKEECVPIGRAVNPNFAIVMTGFSVHHDTEEAHRRGAVGEQWFQHALGEYYADGEHVNGYTNLWGDFEPEEVEVESTRHNLIGTPEEVRETVNVYADQGIDQLSFVMHAGVIDHEHICHSLELFADEVMPEFHDVEERRLERKREELAPHIEEALARKETRDPIAEDNIEPVSPFDRRFDEDDFRANAQEDESRSGTD